MLHLTYLGNWDSQGANAKSKLATINPVGIQATCYATTPLENKAIRDRVSKMFFRHVDLVQKNYKAFYNESFYLKLN